MKYWTDSSRDPLRVVLSGSRTSDTSGDETDASQGRRRVRCKKTYRMKKVYAATEVGRFFVTGATDAANMPSHFYCQLCRKNVSVLTHGHHEVLRLLSGGVVILLATSVCALRHLGGASWIFMEIHCQRRSWSGRGRAFGRVIWLCVIKSTHSQRT